MSLINMQASLPNLSINFYLYCTIRYVCYHTQLLKLGHITVTNIHDCILLLLKPDPFRGMGACRNTMEPQKPGNFSRPGPEVV